MADAAKDYAAGFAAGVATVLVGHPFDTVKVLLFSLLLSTLLRFFHSVKSFFALLFL